MTQKDEINKLNDVIFGNGKPGLKTDVEILKGDMSEIKWWVRGIGSAIILYVLSQWLGMLQVQPVSTVLQAEPVYISVPVPTLPNVLETIPPVIDNALNETVPNLLDGVPIVSDILQ